MKTAQTEPPPDWSAAPIPSANNERPEPASNSTPEQKQPPVRQPDPSQAQTVFRPDFPAPQHDLQRLAALGIHKYSSERLDLYTDLDAETAQRLPAVVDQVYEAWIARFGKLPPARDGRPLRLYGYLCVDRDRLRQAGLIPADLPPFIQGRHRGLEFWMEDQSTDYYRRHLLIHEATHCFMTFLVDRSDPRPAWYEEGIAEVFGTHIQSGSGEFRFAVMPHDKESFPGLGRITQIEQERLTGRFLSFDQFTRLPSTSFLDNRHYAWAWAFAQFFMGHPQWAPLYDRLATQTSGASFRVLWNQTLRPKQPQIQAEWELFSRRLTPGFDQQRAAVEWEPAAAEPDGSIIIQAHRGWQSTGRMVTAGERLSITAAGEAVLGESLVDGQTRPWRSLPPGVTFRYFDSYPLGRLIACVYSPERPLSLLEAFDISAESPAAVRHSGLLLLRVNDSWDSLQDNSGRYRVTIAD